MPLGRKEAVHGDGSGPPCWLIPFSWCQEPGQGFSGCKNSKDLVPSPNCLAFLAQRVLHTSVGQLPQRLTPIFRPGGGCRNGNVKGRSAESHDEGAHDPRNHGTWLLQKSQPLRELTNKYVCAYIYF